MTPKKEDLTPYLNNRKEAAKKFGVTEKTITNWMKKHGIYKPKKNFGCNKLNFEKALEIRKLHKDGLKIKDLAKKYKVTFATISRIVNNLIYKDKNFKNTAVVNVVYKN
jgi:transposase